MWKMKQAAGSWQPNWWRIGAACLAGCCIALILNLLMLQSTYELAKVVMWRQQTAIIDTQRAIIKKQSEMIEALTGGSGPVPSIPKAPPVY